MGRMRSSPPVGRHVAELTPSEQITTKLVDALLNGGNIVYLGNGAPTFHDPNADLNNTGDTIDFASGAFQNFYLNGGFIFGGVLITGPGGVINSPGGPDGTLANTLRIAAANK